MYKYHFHEKLYFRGKNPSEMELEFHENDSIFMEHVGFNAK